MEIWRKNPVEWKKWYDGTYKMPSEDLEPSKVNKEKVDVKTSIDLSLQSSNYGPPRYPAAPTQTIRDMMASFQASRSGKNQDNGLDRTSSTNFHHSGQPLQSTSTCHDDVVQKVLTSTRQPSVRRMTDKYEYSKVPFHEFEPGAYLRQGRVNSKCKLRHSNSGGIVAAARSKAGISAKVGRRKRSKTRGKKRTVDKSRFVVTHLPSVKERCLKVVRQKYEAETVQKTELDDPSAPQPSLVTKLVQPVAPSLNCDPRPQRFRTVRRPKPLLEFSAGAEINSLKANLPISRPVQKAHVLDFSLGKFPGPIGMRDSMKSKQGRSVFPESKADENRVRLLPRIYPGWSSVGFVKTGGSSPANGGPEVFQGKIILGKNKPPDSPPTPVVPFSSTPIKMPINESPQAPQQSTVNKFDETKLQSTRKKDASRTATTDSDNTSDNQQKEHEQIQPGKRVATCRQIAMGKAVLPAKISLAKRISQTTQAWLAKKFSGSKTGREKIDAQLPLPLPIHEKPKKKRITVEEAIANSERIRLQMIEDQNRRRSGTGRMAERVEENLDITRVPRVEVLPRTQVFRTRTDGTVWKRLISSHNLNKLPRPAETPTTTNQFGITPTTMASDTSLNRIGLFGRFLVGIKSVRSKQNHVAPLSTETNLDHSRPC